MGRGAAGTWGTAHLYLYDADMDLFLLLPLGFFWIGEDIKNKDQIQLLDFYSNSSNFPLIY